jgi:hypothetical protein
MTEDPLRFNEGSDFYAYVLNDPIMNIDPSGRTVEVRCLNIQQGKLGLLFGFSHCRVHVTDGNTCISMEWNGKNDVSPQGLETQPCWNNGYPAKVKRGCGGKAGFEQCIISAFKFVEANPQILGKYDPQWNNSNLFIQWLIASCGGDVHFPPFVFWYYPQNRVYGGSAWGPSPIN